MLSSCTVMLNLKGFKICCKNIKIELLLSSVGGGQRQYGAFDIRQLLELDVDENIRKGHERRDLEGVQVVR